jgi:hypothetical protein
VGDQAQEGEDFLLDRLNEAASGDAAVRQLRRRYDLLRHDYEQLLDRLGELEDRLTEAATHARPEVPSTPVAQSIAEAIASPLLRLRDDYQSAVAGIQGVVSGLETLAAGFKGQHSVAGTPAAAPAPAPDAEAPEVPDVPIQKMQIDVRGSGFGELLDFQERLSHLAGVSRVSISAIDNDRATLVVELERPTG